MKTDLNNSHLFQSLNIYSFAIFTCALSLPAAWHTWVSLVGCGEGAWCTVPGVYCLQETEEGHSRTPPVCVCSSFPMSLRCFWQRGAGSLPEGQWLTAGCGLAASPQAQGLQLARAGDTKPTKGLLGTPALPDGLSPCCQPCPGTSRPANASVSGHGSEKPASVPKGKKNKKKKKSSSWKTVPAQPGVPSASEQTDSKLKTSSRGRRSRMLPGIFCAVCKNTKPAVSPPSCPWPEPGVCCCGAPNALP